MSWIWKIAQCAHKHAPLGLSFPTPSLRNAFNVVLQGTSELAVPPLTLLVVSQLKRYNVTRLSMAPM